jgi:hydroxyacylglutathione hydrolase
MITVITPSIQEGNMPSGIQTIDCGGVNCYLIKTNSDFILVDTGTPNKRLDVERDLENAACKLGDLKLIIITHGDYDHAGNAAYLREKYGVKVAMHSEDSGRVEQGNWKLGFKNKPDRFLLMFRIVSAFIKPGPFDKFKPDIYLEDGQSLSEYSSDAQVIHLPGHTRGSIGILTPDGNLLCGDLMSNFGKPGLQFFIDDMAAAKASIAKLQNLKITTVYPGHGKPFLTERIIKI